MTVDEKIAALRTLSTRLDGLLRDPQPGLATWSDAVGRLLTEIATFAPEVMEPTRVGSGAMRRADLFRVCARASGGEDTFYVAVPKVGDAQHVFAAAVLTATEANAERQQANTRTREIRSVERFGDVFIEAKSS